MGSFALLSRSKPLKILLLWKPVNVSLPDLDFGAEFARSFLPEASHGLSFFYLLHNYPPTYGFARIFMVSFFSIFVWNIGAFAKSPWVTLTILTCGKDWLETHQTCSVTKHTAKWYSSVSLAAGLGHGPIGSLWTFSKIPFYLLFCLKASRRPAEMTAPRWKDGDRFTASV